MITVLWLLAGLDRKCFMKSSSFQLSCLLILVYQLCICSSAYGGPNFHHHETTESQRQSGYNFYWRVIHDEYHAKHFGDPETQEKYHELVDKVLRTRTDFARPFINTDLGVQQVYSRLLQLDPDPPLALQHSFYSSQFNREENHDKREDLGLALAHVAERMEDRGYPLNVIGSAAVRAAEMLRLSAHADEARIQQLYDYGVSHLVEAAKCEGLPREYQEFVLIRIARYGYQYSALDNHEKSLFCQRLIDTPDVDRWIGHYSMGKLLKSLAWEARGKEWGYEVSAEQWNAFHHLLGMSHEHLTRAWMIRPEWPDAAIELINASMGYQVHPVRDERFWFAEAIHARPDSHRAYTHFAYSLRPRWGGSIEEMGMLIDWTGEYSQTQNHLAYIYMSMLSSLSRELDDPYEVFSNQRWLNRLNELILQEVNNPQLDRSIWDHRKLLRTAALANYSMKRYEQVAEFSRLGGSHTFQYFSGWKAPTYFSSYQAVLSTPAYKQASQALRAMDNDDNKGALSILLEIEELMSQHPEWDDPQMIGSPSHSLKGWIRVLEARIRQQQRKEQRDRERQQRLEKTVP